MLSLNTNLSLETIKKSKKLQGMIKRELTGTDLDSSANDYNIHSCTFPTIADIIDNAESLFPNTQFGTADIPQSHLSPPKWKLISHEILKMCLNDKPLKEIEDYIIKNLKQPHFKIN